MGKNNNVNIKSQVSKQNTQRTSQQKDMLNILSNDQQQSYFNDELEQGQCFQSQDQMRQSHNINPHHQKSLDGIGNNSYHENKFLSGFSQESKNNKKIHYSNHQANSLKKQTQIQSDQFQQQSSIQDRNNYYSKLNSQQIIKKSLNTQMSLKNIKNESQTNDQKKNRSNPVFNNQDLQQIQQQQRRLVRSCSSKINQFSSNVNNQSIYCNQAPLINSNGKGSFFNINNEINIEHNATDEDQSLYNNKLQLDIIENILNKEEQYQNWRDENIQLKEAVKSLKKEINDYKNKCGQLEQYVDQLEQSICQSKNNYQLELIKFSDQIQKFKNIQLLYQNEKQTKEKIEKELIFKDQELADMKQHLKNSILFLLEQRDSIFQNKKTIKNPQLTDSFSFEEKTEELSNFSQIQSKQQDNFQNQLLKSFDKYINSISQIINELKITYSSQLNKYLNENPQQFIDYTQVEQQPIKQKDSQINSIIENTLSIKKQSNLKQKVEIKKGLNKTNQNQNMSSISSNSLKTNIPVDLNKIHGSQNQIYCTESTEEDQAIYIPSVCRLANQGSYLDNKNKQKNIILQRPISQDKSVNSLKLTGDFLSQTTSLQQSNYQNCQLKDKGNKANIQSETQEQDCLEQISQKIEFNETFQKINDANQLNNETLTFDFEVSSSKKQNKQNMDQENMEIEKNKKQVNKNRGRNSSLGSFEYTKFKQNLEEHINNNDSIFQNTAFNSQLLEQSAAIPLQNKNILNQQQSITDFEIAEESEKAGIFSKIRKTNKQEQIDQEVEDFQTKQIILQDKSFSDSELENRCQSLSTRIFKNQQISMIQNCTQKYINEDKSQKKVQSPSKVSYANNCKKPPIDVKDKENKCPNNNNGNSEELIKVNSKLKQSYTEQKTQVSPNQVTDQNKFVVSKEEFIGQQDGHLTFKQGEKIQVLKQTKNGWWIGMCNNKIGYFPFNFVQEIKDLQINTVQTQQQKV
ncbi:hypothetical protein ABPG74_019000 [Tetrahymena malaccensis]